MPKIIEDQQIYRDIMLAVTKHGYAAATTKRLAQAAGVGEVTLFRRYGNKAQLVKQAMLALAEEADFEATVHYTGDVHADLLRVVAGYQDSAEKNGLFFYTILIEAARHPELMDALAVLQTRLDGVGRLLAQYQADGVLKPTHPIHMLTSLVGPLIAMNMMKSALSHLPLPLLDLENHVANFIDGHRVKA
ncbi:MAG: TetR/AcrR family transcriptional regulator [Anaerolineales bacterium]|nr:TetR/AcrR family transcriptional regulator [Anaerolineales bacterium]